MDELTLYQTDRPAWLALVGPRYAPQMMAMDDAQIACVWSGMTRDYKEAVWAHLSPAQQERVRMVRSGALPNAQDKLTDAQQACLRGDV